MLDLQPIEARLAAATPGPWHIEKEGEADGCFIARVVDDLFVMAPCQHLGEALDDADLIANAPADLTALVAEVERLRAAIKAHQEEWGKSWNSDCEATERLWRVLQ